jgi:hypothetical protein
MSLNEKMIRKYISEYQLKYMEKFNEKPRFWFTYLKWLSGFTPAGSFNHREMDLAEGLLKTHTQG